jgi:hypothetical protein
MNNEMVIKGTERVEIGAAGSHLPASARFCPLGCGEVFYSIAEWGARRLAGTLAPPKWPSVHPSKSVFFGFIRLFSVFYGAEGGEMWSADCGVACPKAERRFRLFSLNFASRRKIFLRPKRRANPPIAGNQDRSHGVRRTELVPGYAGGFCGSAGFGCSGMVGGGFGVGMVGGNVGAGIGMPGGGGGGGGGGRGPGPGWASAAATSHATRIKSAAGFTVV